MQFFKKIQDIIINNNVDYTIKTYGMDFPLLRHFLHNQKDDSLFIDIKDKLVELIIKKQEDESIKFKLLTYFEDWCIQNHSDEIVNILEKILQNTQNIVLRRRVGMCIGKLEPNENFALLSEVLCLLIKNTDQMTREFTIKSAVKFINQYTEEQVGNLLNAMFFTDGSEEDVVQASVSLSLKFSWKDLRDASFRESANFLGEILQKPIYALKFLALAMKVYDGILSDESEKVYADTWKIKYTYSWWLPKIFPVQKSKFEYESEKDKRMALEIWNALIELDKQDVQVAVQVCEKIIEKWEYLVYFEILSRFLNDKWETYKDIVGKLLCNEDLRRMIDILEKKWSTLFKKHLAQYHNEINKFETLLVKYSLDDNKIELRIKAELATLIPEWQISPEVQQIKDQYNDMMKREYNVTDILKEKEDEDENDIYATIKKSTFDLSNLTDRKEISELKSIIEQYVKSENTFDKDIWDLTAPFEEYISKNSDQLSVLYSEIKALNFKDRWQWLLYWLACWYINHYKDGDKTIFYEQIVNLYEIFSDTKNINESQARLAIARSLEEGNTFLRSADTSTLKEENTELFEKIKKLVIQLATDPDPIPGENQEHVWLNSVRWLGVRLLCILTFHYPKTEEDLNTTIEKISNDDENPGIQAQLIENLVYLIPDSKDYTLCEEVIAKFKYTENPLIQNALVRYIFRLWNHKIEKNKDLIEILCKAQDNRVKSQIWDLVWQALLNDADVADIFAKVLKGDVGEETILEAITLEFQNNMPKILNEWDAEKRDKYLWYFEQIVDFKPSTSEERHAVWSRLWYCFYDAEKLPDISFDLLYSKGILNKLITIQSSDTQKNINKFFLRFVKEDKYIENILTLLQKQMEVNLGGKYPVMLLDEWLSEEIIKILKYLYAKNTTETLTKEIFEKVESLFNEWLKYGEKGFYEIFYEYYNK